MDPDRHEIAAAGEPLRDRMRNDHTGEIDGEPSRETTDLLGEFDERRVESVWGRPDLDVTAIRDHVAFERWAEDEPLPAWIDDFERLLGVLSDGRRPVPDELETEIPFVHLLWPLVEHGGDRITDGSDQLLGPTAVADLQRSLLEDLSDVLAQPLYVDFERYADENASGERSPDSTTTYDEYVRAFLDGRGRSFFETYPMAAKLLTVTVEQWVAAVTRFRSRLRDDLESLGSLIDVEAVERVDGITPLGDPHGGNRRVLVVEFDTGEEVVYKPRCIDPERSLYEFQSWFCEAFEDVPDLETPTVVAGRNYGWVEKVERVDHEDDESVAQYYRGGGALLAILYLLNATDCHCENVVAGERSPVLIDPETMFEMEARPVDADRRSTESDRWRLMNRTVLGTGLLPHDELPDGASGLAGIEGRQAASKQCTWVRPNTDAMDVEYVTPVSEPFENFPTRGGSPAPPDRFVDELVAGFEAAYDAIAGSRDRIESALRERFEGIETRILLRNSWAYDALLDTVTTPKYLRSGARFDLKVQDSLSMRPEQPVLGGETKLPGLDVDRWDEIVDAEREGLQRGDVPKFTTYADDRGLYFDGTKILAALTERTGFERVRDRLDEFSTDDRGRQVQLIRHCFTEETSS